MPVKRCAYGDGRKAHLKDRRRELASKISDQIYNRLDLDWVEASGNLFHRTADLRKRHVKSAYSFLQRFQGRVFTKRLCLLTTRKLIRKLPFDLARNPRLTKEENAELQADRLHRIARKCKRMSAADNTETQPWDSSTEVTALQCWIYITLAQKTTSFSFFGGVLMKINMFFSELNRIWKEGNLLPLSQAR